MNPRRIKRVAKPAANPLILNLLKDERIGRVSLIIAAPYNQSSYHVIPSLAEESENPEMEPTAGLSGCVPILAILFSNQRVHPSTMFRMNGRGGRSRMNGFSG